MRLAPLRLRACLAVRALPDAAEVTTLPAMSSDAPLLAAIGDVHGRADLLDVMLSGLDALADRLGRQLVVYFLGDIVDRGPASRQSLDRVVTALRDHPGSRLFLGNHDDWMRDFLRGAFDDALLLHWLGQGGAETLLSYGIEAIGEPEDVRCALLEEHPDHATLLENASTVEARGRYLFVHAGIDPARPVDAQSVHDCLWIREPFLQHVGALSHIVVHGHTPQTGGRPVVTENRISLDTGAVLTGALSAFVLDEADGRGRFVAATEDGFGPIEPQRLDRGCGTVLDVLPLAQG